MTLEEAREVEKMKQALGDEYEKMASGVSREEIVDKAVFYG